MVEVQVLRDQVAAVVQPLLFPVKRQPYPLVPSPEEPLAAYLLEVALEAVAREAQPLTE